MGAYINPPLGQTKEDWLAANATEHNTSAEAKEAVQEDEKVIFLVNNGPFTAAAVAFDDREFEEFTRPEDARPKTFFTAKVSDLLEVSDLEFYL